MTPIRRYYLRIAGLMGAELLSLLVLFAVVVAVYLVLVEVWG